MKKFTTLSTHSTNLEEMPHSNFCPVLLNGETAEAITSALNPLGLKSTHVVRGLSKKFANMKVYISKEGERYAEANVTFSTRTGEIREDMTVRLISRGVYNSTLDWTKKLQAVRKYVVALIKTFAELNNDEYFKVFTRPMSTYSRKQDARKYEYQVKEFEHKGHYRRSPSGRIYYVRPYMTKIG